MRTITLRTHAWGTLALGALLLGLARPAAAQSCEADGDCGAGYVCHTETYQGCSGMTCRPGQLCPPPVCETYESKYCISAPCSTDADCPSTMVCNTPTYQECSGGGMTPPCDKGDGGCDVPAQIDAGAYECHEVAGDPTCTPRYQLPCHVAADCGAGFACEEQRYTVCSASGMGGAPSKEEPDAMTVIGSAGVGAAGGEAALDAGVAADGGYSYECHEESSGTFYCRLLELPCDSNADCAAGLECQPNPYNYSYCGGGSVADAGVGVGGSPATMGSAGSSKSDEAIAVDAGTGCVEVDNGAPPNVCAPHNYYSGGMYPGEGNSGGGSTGTGGSVGTEADAGVSPPGMGMGGSTGSGSAGKGSDEGDSDSSGHGHDHHPAHHHHQAGHLPRLFGCTVSGGDASSSLATWFGVIGLAAFGLRRRARRA